MKLNINLGILLLVLLSSCSSISSPGKVIADVAQETKSGQTLPITAIANIAGATIELEVAQTPQQQATGLMFRQSLADNQGMLFPFPSERTARFWMKNVPISLDMIFLNGDRVVGLASNVPPCQAEPCPVYGPEVLVDQVVELRGGRAEELGIKVGDTIKIQALDVNN
ncbi:MAG: DUF192 domain-containing protein [Pleurocapsa sp.]